MEVVDIWNIIRFDADEASCFTHYFQSLIDFLVCFPNNILSTDKIYLK